MNGDNGSNPGPDDGTQNKVGNEGDGKPAGNPANDDNKNDGSGDNGGSEKPVTFKSQAELDSLIQKRIDRAVKTYKDRETLSETDRAKAERDDAIAQLRDRDNRDSFISKLGLPAAVGNRVYRSYKEDFDLDDKGNIKNLDDIVKLAKSEFPDLFSKGRKVEGKGDGGGGGNDAGKGGGMNDALRRMAGRS